MSDKFFFNKLIILLALTFTYSSIYAMDEFRSVFREHNYEEEETIQQNQPNTSFPDDLPELVDEDENSTEKEDITETEHHTEPTTGSSTESAPQDYIRTSFDVKTKPKRTKKTHSTKVTGTTSTIDITNKQTSESSIGNDKNQAMHDELGEILKQRATKNPAPKKMPTKTTVKKGSKKAPKKGAPKVAVKIAASKQETLKKAIELLKIDFKNRYGNTGEVLKNEAALIELFGEQYHDNIKVIYGLLANPEGNNIEQAHRHAEEMLKNANYQEEVDLIEL